MDVTRLEKLLNMTTSANDGEALSAMRRANEYVASLGLRWKQVINGEVGKEEKKKAAKTQDYSDLPSDRVALMVELLLKYSLLGDGEKYAFLRRINRRRVQGGHFSKSMKNRVARKFYGSGLDETHIEREKTL